MFEVGPLYEANLRAWEDVIVNQGGTSSGKTYSILQVLFTKAIQKPGLVITIAGQDIPNLKKGAMRDAEEIIANSPILAAFIVNYNKTDRTYTFWNGTIMEFTSYGNSQDAKSGKRDYLFINEANGIPYSVYFELEVRTRIQTFIDYNPNSEFWVHKEVIGSKDEITGEPLSRLIISDHRHNPFCQQKIRDKIEALRFKDEELFKVYGRGLTGKIEGLILRNYNVVDRIPVDAKLIGHGLDFGFTNDPTALPSVYIHNGELWIDERIYETGLTNPMIVDRFGSLGIRKTDEIVADSSEPKSIAEISNYGYRIEGAHKGADSITNSIDILKRYVINVTRESVNLRKEFNTWKWAVDKQTGKSLNIPVDFNNHLIDAIRYIALNKLANDNSGVYNIR